MYPEISVILCSYNSEKFIYETLLSIKEQTYKNYEIVIVDDGSKDKTVLLINNFIQENKNINIKFLKQQNKGLAKARNVAIANCSFNLVAIIDHDDLWHKDKLSTQIQFIIRNDKCYLFFSDFEYLNYNNKYKTRFQIAEFIDNYIPQELNLKKQRGYYYLAKFGCFIGSSTVIFKKEVMHEIGKFDEEYIFLTDYIFFLKLAKKFDIFCSPEVLAKWRFHNENATVKLNSHYIKEMNKLYIIFIKDNTFNLKSKFNFFYKYLKINIKSFFKI